MVWGLGLHGFGVKIWGYNGLGFGCRVGFTGCCQRTGRMQTQLKSEDLLPCG